MTRKFIVTVQSKDEETATIVRQAQGFGILIALLIITSYLGFPQWAVISVSFVGTLAASFVIYIRKEKICIRKEKKGEV